MENSDYFVNRLIQGGIYYFEADMRSKKRPYLIISKDNGYGMDIIAFAITKHFVSSKTSLPIVLNGKIGFIRVSGTCEVNRAKIDYRDFSGLLRPDIFSIAIRMYTSRFMDVDERELNKDINMYLDTLESLNYHYRINEKRLFRKEDYLNNIQIEPNNAVKINQVKEEMVKENSNIKIDERPDRFIEQEIIKSDYWSLYRLREFQEKMRKRTDNELSRLFKTDAETVKYLRSNISYMIGKRKNFRHIK